MGSKRRLKPIMTGRPVGATAFWQASARARLRSTGFSHSAAFPALVAASIKSECVLVERRDQDGVDRLVADNGFVAARLGAVEGREL